MIAEVTELKPKRFGATALKRGERVAVTIEGVTAYGVHIGSFSGTAGMKRMIELDGTGELVNVPAQYIEREGKE